MRAIFGYVSINATSVEVESEFNDLKNCTNKDVFLSIRTDKFISKYISCLSDKIKLAMAGKLVNDCINYKSETDRNNNSLVFIDIPNYDNSPLDNLLVSTNIPDCDNNPMANDSTELIELQTKKN